MASNKTLSYLDIAVKGLQSLKFSARNVTSSINPFKAPPRLLQNAPPFAVGKDWLNGQNGGGLMEQATRSGIQETFTQAASIIDAGSEATVANAAGSSRGFFNYENLKTIGGALSYMTSKWALACFTVVLILNRVSIYACSRRQIRLNWFMRLALRLVPILLFLRHTVILLQVLRCQTSPDYHEIRSLGRVSTTQDWVDFGGEGGFLYWLSSTLLYWKNDAQCCSATGMVQSGTHPTLKGSLSRLWPLFIILSVGNFIQVFSCAIQGQTVVPESGMSLFEHSLAFAESEATVSNLFGLTAFSAPKIDAAKIVMDTTATNSSEIPVVLPKSVILGMLNAPPEVLLVGLISCLNGLASNILAVLGWERRYRLINSTIWGLCYMAAFAWGLLNFTEESVQENGILRMPTVCIIGFIPHLLILLGILICATIYLLALVFSALSPPPNLPQPTTLRERLVMAHENLQATVQLSNIRVNMREDFYSALLRIGVNALTAASEAVFLNEARSVAAPRMTWIEEDRIKAFEQDFPSLQDSLGSPPPPPSRDNEGVRPLLTGGYAKERTTKELREGAKAGHDDPLGSGNRRRQYLTLRFYRGILKVLAAWFGLGFNRILDKASITWRPRWLEKLIGQSKLVRKRAELYADGTPTLEFWILSEDGVLSLPDDDDVDVEEETKKRLEMGTDSWGAEDDDKLDNNLYQWWKHGGWWGIKDQSGPYEESDVDDTTSMISMATDQSEDGWESDNEDGRRTPTQFKPFPEDEPNHIDYGFDRKELARLLDPTDPEARQEARILAQHLRSNRIVTRSQYRKSEALERAHVLTSTRYRPAGFRPSDPESLTPNEEAELLERLIIFSRSQRAPTTEESSWQEGAEGLGSSGPQCVVCQGAPRTIMAWPCRCLSLCEDCRVSLAMNNFGTCVCCRQDVTGFSRLYVP
ncbi:MAG: hypothetical protein M1834_005848 [Cirrosporium novae-zelandiae]|nr:MAG: hypothetical protein M1834_005848 [Cirrosporium novae-zelandiae]